MQNGPGLTPGRRTDCWLTTRWAGATAGGGTPARPNGCRSSAAAAPTDAGPRDGDPRSGACANRGPNPACASPGHPNPACDPSRPGGPTRRGDRPGASRRVHRHQWPPSRHRDRGRVQLSSWELPRQFRRPQLWLRLPRRSPSAMFFDALGTSPQFRDATTQEDSSTLSGVSQWQKT